MTPSRLAEIRAYINRLDLDQLPPWTVEQAIIRDLFEALQEKAEPEKPFHSLIASPGPYSCTGCEWTAPWNLMQNAAERAWSNAHTANPYRIRADVS